MSVKKSYNEWARTYDLDSNATRDLDQVALKRVLGRRRFGLIVEAGCGTGKNTASLARLGRRVQALDFSPGMIARAKGKIGAAANVEFAVADITKRWPAATGSAELVTCNLVLEHVKDLSRVFAQAARVLQPGGWFFVSELHPFRQYKGTVANFQRDGKTTEIPAFVHHVSDFLEAGERRGFGLKKLQEWWHVKDEGKPPRLVTFLFEKG